MSVKGGSCICVHGIDFPSFYDFLYIILELLLQRIIICFSLTISYMYYTRLILRNIFLFAKCLTDIDSNW